MLVCDVAVLSSSSKVGVGPKNNCLCRIVPGSDLYPIDVADKGVALHTAVSGVILKSEKGLDSNVRESPSVLEKSHVN